ncbi:hypothetical protein SNEBB_000514 [Seison nebaliae]|nr:hypothetical protein SNEBB_000514 [Seison nebaliae]
MASELPVNSLRFDMAYPKTCNLTSDLIHVLPTVLTIPPIQPENFACNRYHLIQLTKLEAKDLAETQQNFLTFLQPFNNLYEFAMLAYKRTLHIALTSFSMKLLIFFLTFDSALKKYNAILDDPYYKDYFEKKVQEFAKRMKTLSDCFTAMRTASQEELDFVFESFIHQSNDTLPLAYDCSFIGRELLTSFAIFMRKLFIPVSKILNKKFNKPPMMLMRLTSINQIQMGKIRNISETFTNILNVVRSEYNFWHQIPTNQNPSLYYMTSSICHLQHEYEQRKIKDFSTLFSFRSTDGIEQLYYEHVSTEVRLFSYLLEPLNTFANKYMFIVLYNQEELYPLDYLLELMNEDEYLKELMEYPVTPKTYTSIVIENNVAIDHDLRDLPLSKALNFNTKTSITKVKYVNYARRQRAKRSRSGNRSWQIIEIFDPRKLKGNLQPSVLASRKFDKVGRIIPLPLRDVQTYNPMEYWPLMPTERKMCNRPGKPYDIFPPEAAFSHLIKKQHHHVTNKH